MRKTEIDFKWQNFKTRLLIVTSSWKWCYTSQFLVWHCCIRSCYVLPQHFILPASSTFLTIQRPAILSPKIVSCNINSSYSHSRKTMNTRENFWNVYCFTTNQKGDETAEDNRQTAAWISHDLIRNNELGFSSTTNLQFYRFQILKLLFLYFSLFMCKE